MARDSGPRGRCRTARRGGPRDVRTTPSDALARARGRARDPRLPVSYPRDGLTDETLSRGTSLVSPFMKRRERTRIALGAAVAGVALVCGMAWVVFSLMPIRAAEGGPFARHSSRLLTRCSDRRRVQSGRCSAPRLLERGSCPPACGRRSVSSTGSRARASSRCLRAVSRGRVVFGTHDGHVIGASVTGGSRLWRTDIRGCIASAPAVRAGIVYIGWSGPLRVGRARTRRVASSRSASGPDASSGASMRGMSSRARRSSRTGSSSQAFEAAASRASTPCVSARTATSFGVTR